jgi:tRNA 2-thiouridine synthesizing protein D
MTMAELTIVLTSGSQENEDAVFAVNLALAALKKGHKVNLFLYGNGSNLANKEHPWPGTAGIQEDLLRHIDSLKVGPKLEELAQRGANISTCHTTEYGRGTEGDEYQSGIKRGNVGEDFAKYLLTTDVLLTLGH